MKVRTLWVAAALSLAACTHGQNFEKPSLETFNLGVTSRFEVQSKFGNPYRQSATSRGDDETSTAPSSPFAAVPVAGSMYFVSYLYHDDTLSLLFNRPVRAKVINFAFWNDVLVGYNFVSGFTADSSNFNERFVSLLERGKTRKIDVEQMVGPPTGRVVYPLLRDNGDEEFIYEYVEIAGAIHHERRAKSLYILFDRDGVLRDYSFSSSNTPLPMEPGPAIVPVPVILPKK